MCVCIGAETMEAGRRYWVSFSTTLCLILRIRGLTEPAAPHLTRLDSQRAPDLSLSSNAAVTGTCSHKLAFTSVLQS